MVRLPIVLIFVASLLSNLPVRALIVLDTTTSLNNSKNVIEPANSATFPTSPAVGVPWQHVVRYGLNNASAVYVGNGFLLTARHVGTSNTGLRIQGMDYARDTQFAPVPITVPGSPNVFVDMQVQKIVGDPGLPVLPLALPSTSDLNRASVLVGCGKGKGALISGQGWNWGDDASRSLRWGTGTTAPGTTALPYLVGSTTMNYTRLRTSFSALQGSNSAAATTGDSGSALFQSFSGNWTLSGIGTVVSTLNASYYMPSDSAYFVRLREYSWALRIDAWKAKFGISQSATDSSDADGDGVPLLMEYALGMDPTTASAAGLPVPLVESSSLVLTFTRLASVTDIKLEVETSSTLQPGEWAVEPAIFTVLDSTTVIQTIRASVPVGPGDRKFARLRVTRL